MIVLDPEIRDDSGQLPLPDFVPAATPVDRQAAHLLNRAVREDRLDLYDRYRELVESRPVTELHDLLELVPAGPPLPSSRSSRPRPSRDGSRRGRCRTAPCPPKRTRRSRSR